MIGAFSSTDGAAAARCVDADSPWLGLLPFTEATQRFFFGRDADIREIFLRTRDHALTVLYGQSGYGKTSLLNAGLIPKLRADGFRPVLLRLRFEKGDAPLTQQVRAALAAACADEDASAEELLARWGDATLWECFHHPKLRAASPSKGAPVLIFDQFEEVFTLGETQRAPAEIDVLAAELANLIENRPPASVQMRLADDLEFAGELDFAPAQLRVIITLREDFLSRLERWKAALPSLMRNRMPLDLLRGPQALQAVVKPGQLDGRNLVSDEVGAQIVRVIARRPPGTPLEEIEAVPPLLSLLCDELNRARGGAPAITSALVEQRHGDILHEFYTRCFEGFPPAVRRFVEDRLVTVTGHRNLAAREDAELELARAGVSAPAAALDTLLERRLLNAEERGGTRRIEITHDVLTSLVTESRDLRRQRERAEQAEAERLAAQAEAARVRDEKARLSRLAIAAVIAAVLAIAGMIFGLVGMNQASTSQTIAEGAQKRAEASEKSAKMEKESAVDAKRRAEEKEQAAQAANTALVDAKRRAEEKEQTAQAANTALVEAQRALQAAVQEKENEASRARAAGTNALSLAAKNEDMVLTLLPYKVVSALADNETKALEELCANFVDYLEYPKKLTRAEVLADHRRDVATWPHRNYSIIGTPGIEKPGDGTVRFVFALSYTAIDKKKETWNEVLEITMVVNEQRQMTNFARRVKKRQKK